MTYCKSFAAKANDPEGCWYFEQASPQPFKIGLMVQKIQDNTPTDLNSSEKTQSNSKTNAVNNLYKVQACFQVKANNSIKYRQQNYLVLNIARKEAGNDKFFEIFLPTKVNLEKNPVLTHSDGSQLLALNQGSKTPSATISNQQTRSASLTVTSLHLTRIANAQAGIDGASRVSHPRIEAPIPIYLN